MVYAWCDVLSGFVVVGKRISVDTACYGFFCFVIIVFSCVYRVLLVDWSRTDNILC